MTLNELSIYFDNFLHLNDFNSDISKNGIQVENSNPDTKEIKKVAFAVDACQETIERAIKTGAQLLFVHHGIFWGSCDTITGIHYKRIAKLIKNDIALYACHIPLDANNPYGNNFGMAARLGLENTRAFGCWRGMSMGAIGKLPEELSIDELIQKAFPNGNHSLHVLPFGKKKIKVVAIISGGAGDDVDQAIAAGADAYITGEIQHEQYHFVEENHMNVISGGHYETETIGVNLVRQKLEQEKGIETVFLDVPTNL
ncbi:MAG: Nif3-like dinuclear metal center hexameric protein [Treponema sp.]|nr:Nif3-like dinuclear metal center hexameric protein [Treponema sp.]